MHLGAILHRLFWSHQNQIIDSEYQWAKVYSKVNLLKTQDKRRHPRMPWTLGTLQASIRRNRPSTSWWPPLPPPTQPTSCRNPPSPKPHTAPNPEGVVTPLQHRPHSKRREESNQWQLSQWHTETKRRSWRCSVATSIHTGSSSNSSIRPPRLPLLSQPERCSTILCRINSFIILSNRRALLKTLLNLYLEVKGLQGE